MFTVDKWQEVYTNKGWIYAYKLQCDDVLLGENNLSSIVTKIVINGQKVKIYIRS